jgi:transcriptional regulator with XRE-family HTH domain
MDKSIYTHEYKIMLRLLKEAREAAGITQVQLAAQLRQSQSFVSKTERGESRLDVVQLRTLCRIFGITLSTFVQRLERELIKMR